MRTGLGIATSGLDRIGNSIASESRIERRSRFAFENFIRLIAASFRFNEIPPLELNCRRKHFENFRYCFHGQPKIPFCWGLKHRSYQSVELLGLIRG